MRQFAALTPLARKQNTRAFLRESVLRQAKLLMVLVTFALPVSDALSQMQSTLPPVVVRAVTERGSDADNGLGTHTIQRQPASDRLPMSGDSAQLLAGIPGLSLNLGGGVSSLPSISGLADDRLRILVNGMAITSSCPNHMNPALSYIDSSAVERISVMAGIVPVSLGGDSIGGTIAVQSAEPVFADVGATPRATSTVSGYYRSNGNVSGYNALIGLTSETFSLNYAGSTVQSGNYEAGDGKPVKSTSYKARNNLLSLATKLGGDTLSIDVGWQEIPSQAYVNQYMDMISNRSISFNFRYKGRFDWGRLEAGAFRQRVRHSMDMLEDKQPNMMRMETRGLDTGYLIQAEVQLAPQHAMRIGGDLHSFRLDNWWPFNSDMGEDQDFISIEGGRRDRLGLFGELESRWNAAWTTSLGIRIDRVVTNSGNVQGYFSAGLGMDSAMGPYIPEAASFNAVDHKRRDHHIDLTAFARYDPTAQLTLEFGYARNTRSPNLFERYAWSTEGMAASMISWFGDGNLYVGNLDLRPEVAHTIRSSIEWHDGKEKEWSLKVSPYLTRVDDFIGVSVLGTNPNGMGGMMTWRGRSLLQFANHDAQLFGVDASGRMPIGHARGLWTARGSVSYTRGKDLNSNDGLYNIMPLSARVSLEHKLGSWSNSLDVHAVTAKKRVSAVRGELGTSGYSLVGLRSSYKWRHVRLDAGIENLFSKRYDLASGGANVQDYMVNTALAGPLSAVPGPGRSINFGISIDF